jgi:hypothetical protein
VKKFCTKEKAASHQVVNGIKKESKLTTFYPIHSKGLKLASEVFQNFLDLVSN